MSKSKHHPKIDLRMVPSIPASGCPYQTSDNVACGNHRTTNESDEPFQYICICDPSDGESQIRDVKNE